MALRELVVEQEEEAVKALAGCEVKFGDDGLASGWGDEVGNERSLRRPGLEWGFGTTGHRFLTVPRAAFMDESGFTR
jgi:hypothetical protein